MPEENERRVTDAVRHDVIARRRLSHVPGRRAGGGDGRSACGIGGF